MTTTSTTLTLLDPACCGTTPAALGLVEAGLLTRKQRGRWAYYRLVPSAVDDFTAGLPESLQGR